MAKEHWLVTRFKSFIGEGRRFATEAEGGAKLSVMSVKIGGALEKVFANSTVSRVRFRLPVRWPIAESPPRRSGKS